MQRALEQALDHAEYVTERAQQRPPKRKYSSSGKPSLHEKLYDIYVEECEREPEVTEELRSNVNLLEKLVRRESLPCLVVNLYPGKEGYSLMLKGKNGSYSESIRLPYEEKELLEYLDAEELPPVLVDRLEKSPVNLFHRGCVIAEIRDYRQSSGKFPPGYQSRHILLRPTMQTLVCDVQAITSDTQKWTQEDRLLLESQLILATAEPLCLDPSVSVACTANRLLYNKQKLNTLPMKRSFKRYAMASLNRQQELSQCPPPPELRVLTSGKKIRESKTGERDGLKAFQAGSCVDTWRQRPCDLAVPSQVDVEKYAKGKKAVGCDDSQPTVWPRKEARDGFVFGCEAGYQSQATRQTTGQQLDNSIASGQRAPRQSACKKATLERELCPPNSSSGDHSNSVLPRPKTDAGQVASQTQEVAQERAQCPAQMSLSSDGPAGLRPSPGKEPEQPQITCIVSSALGRGARHPPPLQRLPWRAGQSPRGDRLTPQQAGGPLASPSPAPAPRPPGLFQNSFVELHRVSWIPAAALSAAGASQRPPGAPVTAASAGPKGPGVAGPGGAGPASERGSAPGEPAPAGARPPAARRRGGGVQLLVKGPVGVEPLTLVQLPRGPLLWSSGQQAPPPPRLFQLVRPPSPPRPAAAARPGQPPALGSRSRASGGQGPVPPVPQAVVVHLGGAQGFLQPRAALPPQPGLGSGRGRPGPSLPPRRAGPPAAPRPQVRLRLVPGEAAPARATAFAELPGQRPQGQQAASPAEGQESRGPQAASQP